MAKSKEDIKYGTAQAKLSEDEALRVSYKAGMPLEGGKVADSQPVDLFSSARNISSAQQNPIQGGNIIACSEPVDVFSSARRVEETGEGTEGQLDSR
ncbi:second mef2-like protein 1 [Orobanche hederae]